MQAPWSSIACGGQHLFRTSDFDDVYDALSDDTGDEREWSQRVLQAALGVYEDTAGLGWQRLEHDDDFEVQWLRHELNTPFFNEAPNPGMVLRLLNRHGFLRVYYPSQPVVSVSEMLGDFGVSVEEVFEQVASPPFYSVGVLGHPMPNRVEVLFCLSKTPIKMTAHDRRCAATLGLHFAAAVTARAAQRIEGMVTLDGEVLEGHFTPRTLWQSLCGGKVMLAPRGRGPARHYQVIPVSPSSRFNRALTRKERAAVELSQVGLLGKQQAWELGVAPTTVSRLTQRASVKLGLLDRLQLSRLVSGLTAPRHAPVSFTSSELAVFELAREGLSNREIAEVRGTSVNTVANQVASILRKTGASSRRALMGFRRPAPLTAPSAP